jgi:AAA+ superfamily predicted ATPase
MEIKRANEGALIHQALCNPVAAISYTVSQQLAALYPEKAFIEGDACSFDLEAYASGGQCAAEKVPAIHHQIATAWYGPGSGLRKLPENAWYAVSWQGHMLEVLLMTWPEGMSKVSRCWILAETEAIADRFFLDVCEWCAEIRGEVLVFDGGRWQKSEELFRAIQDVTLDNLILRGSLKQEIQDDLAHFFASREMYERYRVPWKRGVLFIGPPGNGKTHAVKALINAFDQPCLYVKSFKAEWRTDHDSIRDVFKRARQTTPCILVLEDLDSLVDGQNRSFFLNELDGFASNAGIVTLATTNHPERLDPAIVDRPSRFDRKYHFELPGSAERLAYLSLWNEALQPALRLSDPAMVQMVELTEEFSFAYIKELILSSTMCWMTTAEPGEMPAVMAAQAAALREQMSSMSEEPAELFEVDEESFSPQAMGAMVRQRMAAMMRRQRGAR